MKLRISWHSGACRLFRYGVLAAALAVALPSAGARADSHLLGNQELIALLNGATLDLKNIENDGRRYYRFQPVEQAGQHGKLDLREVGANVIERGMWWVEDEEFCVLHQHVTTIRKRCFAVQRDGEEFHFIELRYELPGHHVERPHRLVPSAQIARAPSGAGNYHLLNDEELIALLNGMHFYSPGVEGPHQRTLYFLPVSKPGEHAKMFGVTSKGKGAERGTWWVEDEQFCVFFSFSPQLRKICYAVARDGNDIRFIMTRWQQPGLPVERPHQWVPATQIFRTVG